MKRLVPLLALTLTITACAAGPRGPRLAPRANPSAVIAAELAFAKLAQDKGQWTAFRETSTGEAVMFVPQRVVAHTWLKGRADPPVAVRWQPHQVWSSCDGSYAVTHGAWQRPNNTVGYFTTIWQRQKDGRHKWVLDHGDALPFPLDPPEMIAGKVAECGPKPAFPLKAPPPPPPGWLPGQAADNPLVWNTIVEPDGARRVVVSLWNGKAYDVVLDEAVAAEAK